MDYTNLTKEELLKEIERLNKSINEQNNNIISSEDRLKLEILKRLPFSMWACDRNFKIVLWTCQSEKMYNVPKEKAIGKNYLELFVDKLERPQSKRDCIDIIENDYQQHNCCAFDKKPDGSTLAIVTNVFRIWDEERKEWLQAEVGLDITDYDQNKKFLEKLRELELAHTIEEERKREQAINQQKLDILKILDDGYRNKLSKIKDNKELVCWLRRFDDRKQAQDLKKEQNELREEYIKDLRSKKMDLEILINNANTLLELIEIKDKVVKFIDETI